MRLTVDIFMIGVGGQGVLLASRILGLAALMEKREVTLSEVHGMAQRGGVVTCDVRIGLRDEMGPWSPLIQDGRADVLLSFEPLETARGLSKVGKKTVVITSTAQMVPFTVGAYGQSYPPVAKILEEAGGRASKVIHLNAAELAREAGSIRAANVVMVGALHGSGALELDEQALRTAIKESVPAGTAEINLKAFELGRRVAAGDGPDELTGDGP